MVGLPITYGLSDLSQKRGRIRELTDTLEAIRGMLSRHAGQPNLYGELFNIADSALANPPIGKTTSPPEESAAK